MRGNKSIAIWLVVESGYEHTDALSAYTKKSQAEREVARLGQVNGNRLVLGYHTEQINLLVHAGCHVLHDAKMVPQ
jgi:flagellar biogenesis protein FliO